MSIAIPYLILILLLAVLAMTQDLLSASLRQRAWMPCMFMMVVFFGLRAYIGDDWLGYYPMFANVQPHDFHFNVFGHYTFRYEPGFAMLAYACRQIAGGGGYLFFQFVVTLIQVLLLFRFLRRTCYNVPFALVVFLAMGGLIMFINTMRNTLAILIFINGLHFITERRFWPYLAVCLLSMMFHMSSFLYIPLYFFLHRRISKWFFLSVFILCYLIVLLRVPLISGSIGLLSKYVGGKLLFMASAYLNDENMNQLAFALSIGSLERMATGIIIFCYWDKLLAIRPQNVLYINAIFLFFICYFTFSEVREVGKRLSELFIFSYWVLWPDLLKCFASRTIRMLYLLFLCIYCSMKVVGTVGYPNTRYENVMTGYTNMRLRSSQHADDIKQMNKNR